MFVFLLSCDILNIMKNIRLTSQQIFNNHPLWFILLILQGLLYIQQYGTSFFMIIINVWVMFVMPFCMAFFAFRLISFKCSYLFWMWLIQIGSIIYVATYTTPTFIGKAVLYSVIILVIFIAVTYVRHLDIV